MKISWSGMPTAEDVKRTAEGWLGRTPADIAVSMGIDPAAKLRLVFGLGHLSPGDVDLLGRERFRKHSVLFLDDYLNASSHGVSKRAVWLATMVGTLLFPSEAESSLFGIMYPDVRTPRLAILVVQAPEKRVEKHRRKKKVVDTDLVVLGAARDEDLDDFEKSPGEEAEADPMEQYEKRLEESAQDFWNLVRSLAI